MKSTVILAVLCLLLMAPLAHARSNSPAAIKKEVTRQGAKATVAHLWEDRKGWTSLIHHVEKGEKEWVDVAVLLLPGADAGATAEIKAALPRALAANPEHMLRLVRQQKLELDEVCDDPSTVDDSSGDVQNFLDVTIRQLQKRTFGDKETERLRKDCLARFRYFLKEELQRR